MDLKMKRTCLAMALSSAVIVSSACGGGDDDPVTVNGDETTVDDAPSDVGTGDGSSSPLAPVLADIEEIWYTGRFVVGIDGLRAVFSAVIEFDNGEISTDGFTISTEGVAASKRDNPDKWGEGRVQNSDSRPVEQLPIDQ